MNASPFRIFMCSPAQSLELKPLFRATAGVLSWLILLSSFRLSLILASFHIIISERGNTPLQTQIKLPTGSWSVNAQRTM
jgi:hypothetical protein